MTSLDCPICKKSFKLTKAENPDEAWDRHFATECTKIPGTEKPTPLKCAAPHCTSKLGPSNRFQCPHCRLLVCLGCRTVEAHKCTVATPVGSVKRTHSAIAAARVDKLSGNRGFANNTKASTSSSKGRLPKNTASRDSKINQENTLRGSAQRRQAQQQQQMSSSSVPITTVGIVSDKQDRVNNKVATFDCPLCCQNFQTSDELVSHVDQIHNFAEPTITSAISSNNNNSSNIAPPTPALTEMCPTCSQRFPDVMTLIHHAETAHRGLGEGTSSTNKCLLS